MRGEPVAPQFAFPRPGPALRVVLLGLFAIWLFFALALNWAGAPVGLFAALTGNVDAILGGEVWRLLTAGLLHIPTGTIGHILSAGLGLYFLGSSLESEWGSARFARFLALATVLSYGTQTALIALLPTSLGARLAPSEFFGAMPAVEATAIAWASSFRGRTVQLFFVLPVSSRGLVLFVIGTSVMVLIAGQMSPSGHLALFAGMGYGYLLGGGTPSPIRRWYLKYRLHRLEVEVRSEKNERLKKAKGQGLRVIEGGGGKSDKRALH